GSYGTVARSSSLLVSGHSALVLVPVVEVGNVRVRVHEFEVHVFVAVSAGEAVCMQMVVVAVVVIMFVGVHRSVVVMFVQMIGTKRQRDTAGGNHHRDDLESVDR